MIAQNIARKTILQRLYCVYWGTQSLYSHNETRRLLRWFNNLKGVLTPFIWDYYISSEDTKQVIAGTVNFKNGSRGMILLKDPEYSYQEWIDIIMASASIPFYTKGQEILGGLHYDGGVRNHILTPSVIKHYPITESVSVYSRPADFRVDNGDWTPKNAVDVLERTLEIMTVEISKKDEELEDLWCDVKSVRQTKLYLPKVLDSLYDTDKNQLLELYNAGLKEGKKYKHPTQV